MIQNFEINSESKFDKHSNLLIRFCLAFQLVWKERHSLNIFYPNFRRRQIVIFSHFHSTEMESYFLLSKFWLIQFWKLEIHFFVISSLEINPLSVFLFIVQLACFIADVIIHCNFFFESNRFRTYCFIICLGSHDLNEIMV